MSEGECQTALKGTCNFLKPEMGMKQSGMEPENKNGVSPMQWALYQAVFIGLQHCPVFYPIRTPSKIG